jgi:hypothetical protein
MEKHELTKGNLLVHFTTEWRDHSFSHAFGIEKYPPERELCSIDECLLYVAELDEWVALSLTDRQQEKLEQLINDEVRLWSEGW